MTDRDTIQVTVTVAEGRATSNFVHEMDRDQINQLYPSDADIIKDLYDDMFAEYVSQLLGYFPFKEDMIVGVRIRAWAKKAGQWYNDSKATNVRPSSYMAKTWAALQLANFVDQLTRQALSV
jgi:hypothetical protein